MSDYFFRQAAAVALEKYYPGFHYFGKPLPEDGNLKRVVSMVFNF